MKVYTKSLKNATEQHDKVIQASLNACIKFNCPFNYSYVYSSINYSLFCDENEQLLGNNCFQRRKDRRRLGESNRAAQDMVQGKIKHKQIRTSRLSKT